MKNRSEKSIQNESSGDPKNDVLEAERTAQKLVEETRSLGTNLTKWVDQCLSQSKPFMKEFGADQLTKIRHFNTPAFEKAFRDAIFWENDISFHIREYFSAISDVLQRLNSLTPPLGLDHVKPKLDEMLTLRRDAMNTLEQLKVILDHADQIKQRRFSFNLPTNDKITFQP